MKKGILLVVFLIFCLGTMTAQIEKKVKKETSSITREEKKLTTFETSEAGWVWKEDKWWYDDTISEKEPYSYSIIETIRERVVENGIEVKKCYIKTRKVELTYETNEPGWKWEKGKWYYNEKVTKETPSNFVNKRTEELHNKDIDCDEK